MMQRLKHALIRAYFELRTWWPLWFFILNRHARALFKRYLPPLNALQSRILGDLSRDGIALSSLDELFPNEKKLDDLRAFAESLPARTRTSKKDFLENYWELTPELDFRNPFLSLALDQKLLAIAQHFMGMWVRLVYYQLARTVPVGNADETHSQRWHRDPEEKRMLKIFIYLSDMDKESGPFIYLPHSTRGQRYGSLAPQRPPGGSYPEPGTVERAVPPEAVRTCTGAAGTVIFCDTSGLHKGGHATKKERLMSTFFYTAATWTEPSRYRLTEKEKSAFEALPADARYALSIKRPA